MNEFDPYQTHAPAQFAPMMEPGWAIGLGVLFFVLAGLAMWMWYHSTKRKRLMEDVPTSKAKGVAIGLTEIKGQAEIRSVLHSRLAEVPCGWFTWRCEEHYRRTRRDSKGNTKTYTGWETVASGTRFRMFYIRDDTGAIRVLPHNAEIEGHQVFSQTCHRSDPLYYGKGPSHGISGSTGKRRFVEHAICPGDQLYIIGTAQLRDDIPAPEIAWDRDGEAFVISVKSEEELISQHGLNSQGGLFLGAIMVMIAPILLAGHTVPDLGSAVEKQALWVVLAALVFCGVGAFLYATLLFNGLVKVMTRMQKAWSLIDIQLQRRHDLIPRLVETVKGAAGHERELNEALAALRVNPHATRGMPSGRDVAASAEVADMQTAAMSQVVAVVERYPQLTSNANFMKLQTELVDTEDRIALARSFYNDSVTAYNERIMTLPDSLFASFCKYQPAQLYQIREFERSPIQVDWSLHAEADDARDGGSDEAALPAGAQDPE